MTYLLTTSGRWFLASIADWCSMPYTAWHILASELPVACCSFPLLLEEVCFIFSCLVCQSCCKGKVTCQPATPVQPIPVPGRRFSHIHIDIVGPLPTLADGHCYLLTMMDHSTRWLEGAQFTFAVWEVLLHNRLSPPE